MEIRSLRESSGRLLWLDVLRQQQKEGGVSGEQATESVAASVAAMLARKLPLHSFEQIE